MSFLIPQRVLSDLEEGYEKSMLTRTKPFLLVIVSKTPKVYNFFSKENAFLFAIYCNLLRQYNLRKYEKATLFWFYVREIHFQLF